MRRLRALIAVVAVATTACGASEEDRVQDVALENSQAFLDGRMQDLCEVMTETSRQAVIELAPALGGGKSCRALMENLRGRMSDVDLAPVDEVQIMAVTIRGDTAIVRDNVFNPTIELRKQAGEWRVEFPGP
jgi:hypothetical protein